MSQQPTSMLQIDFANAPSIKVDAVGRVPTLTSANTVVWQPAAALKPRDCVCHEFAPLGRGVVKNVAPAKMTVNSDARLAIRFALDELNTEEALDFLDDWMEGDLADWPTYIEYVSKNSV